MSVTILNLWILSNPFDRARILPFRIRVALTLCCRGQPADLVRPAFTPGDRLRRPHRLGRREYHRVSVRVLLYEVEEQAPRARVLQIDPENRIPVIDFQHGLHHRFSSLFPEDANILQSLAAISHVYDLTRARETTKTLVSDHSWLSRRMHFRRASVP